MKQKKVGIWGYGSVGKSVHRYALKQDFALHIMDSTYADNKIKDNITYWPETTHEAFFKAIDWYVPSPGINNAKLKNVPYEKMVSEVDLFYKEWNKKIIAITGSVGKTTTTHFLHTLIEQCNKKIITGGNIGTPMLDLLDYTDKEIALLELSSFQLEHALFFRPHIAAWTNIYPNHLDRHKNEDAYFLAKYNILKQQTPDDLAILPTSLKPLLDKHGWPSSRIIFFEDRKIDMQTDAEYCFHNNYIYKKNKNNELISICNISTISSKTHWQNWLLIISLLSETNLLHNNFLHHASELKPLAHRMQTIIDNQNIHVINDSKSTTSASTIAAMNQCTSKNIILMLGGISKGVDRSELIATLNNKVIHVITFGAEACMLQKMCIQNNIPSTACKNLAIAVKAGYEKSTQYTHSTLLFSPSGSSFDLFKDYQERGETFISLVKTIIQ